MIFTCSTMVHGGIKTFWLLIPSSIFCASKLREICERNQIFLESGSHSSSSGAFLEMSIFLQSRNWFQSFMETKQNQSLDLRRVTIATVTLFCRYFLGYSKQPELLIAETFCNIFHPILF